MKILGIYVALCLVIIISCEDVSVTKVEKVVNNGSTDNPEQAKESDNLPILPPIILLDFGDNNSNSSDDKSKRTVDDNLGYGYLSNNLLHGKYNYYFPGGKTGTTVSIEESISPFEPKTIIEQFKPITEKSMYKTPTTTYHPNIKQSEPLRNHHHYKHPQNYVMSPQVFGQRTKLQKYSSPDHVNPPTFSPPPPPPKANGAYTTIRPDYKNLQNTYSLATFTTSRPIYDTYASTPSTYDAHHQNSYSVQRPYDTATTARSLPVDPSAFNIPKYSIENGIRYEHKIVWKYKDGSIATPPTSYMNSYSEYLPQKVNVNYQNVQRNPQTNHQSIGYNSHQQDGRYPQESQNGGYQTSSYQNLQGYHRSNPINNIHNQRPAQFPTDQDTRYQHPTASALTYNGASPQNYNFSYQQKYGFRPQKHQHQQGVRYEPLRQTTQYSVDSSNPEYSTTPSTPADITTPGGELASTLLAKYSPQAQKYLSKVFPQNQEERVKEENNNYEDLLSYNPSISQYINDPRSILNARPTFIQAGGSLIPVIILRVDGRPPVQTQPSPSINLKALLQQYLSQYAEDSRPAHNDNYQKSSAQNHKELNSFSDLTQLANLLSRFTHKQEDQGNYPTQKLADHPLDYHSTRYHDKNSYDTIRDQVDASDSTHGSRIGSKLKVKSVQIIGDS